MSVSYDITDFQTIIEKHAAGNLDDESAAHLAKSEAYNMACLWTDGTFGFPNFAAFFDAIRAERGVE